MELVPKIFTCLLLFLHRKQEFCLAENQNRTNMSGARTKPELNQNQGSVQVVLVLCASSELNFGIPSSDRVSDDGHLAHCLVQPLPVEVFTARTIISI